MPISDDFMPVEKQKLNGRAIRFLDNRKEDNNDPRVSVEQLRKNYASVKQQVIDGLKALGQK